MDILEEEKEKESLPTRVRKVMVRGGGRMRNLSVLSVVAEAGQVNLGSFGVTSRH